MIGTEHETKRKRSVFVRIRRLFGRVLRFTITATGIWVLVHLVGLVPVNNNFQNSPDGVEVVVVSNEVHADLVLPIKYGEIDWLDILGNVDVGGDIDNATHVAIGWGDKGFFIETETWSDLTLSTTANALLIPSDTCLHVNFIRSKDTQNGKRLRLAPQQYEELVAFIETTFRLSAQGEPIQIADAAYGKTDAFFEAKGRYHCLNTCNSWVGRALKAAGVRVGIYTPLPKSVYLYLPDENN